MVEQVLLVLRIGFVVLLYLFIWRIVRLSVRDIRAPQDSMVLGPAAAAAMGLGPSRRSGRTRPSTPAAPAGRPRLVVESGPAFPPGTLVLLDEPVLFGRSDDADARLDDDTYASGHHARVFVRGGEIVVEDLGSTNGTFIDGERVTGEAPLRPGAILQVGSTFLHLEFGS